MKSRHLFLCIGLLAAPGCMQIGQTPSAQRQVAEHFDKVIRQDVSVDYLVYTPAEEDKSPGEKWPTIVFLHGSGERGTNVWDVTKHGPPKLVQTNANFPFIVLSPQCPPGEGWQTAALTVFVKEMERKYPIDPDRVYLTGLSMGGAGTWKMILKQPDLFAAAVPICGDGDTNSLPYLGAAQLDKIRKLPIWAFHGEKDEAVPVKKSEEMTAALKALGANVQLTIYPDAPHDSWTRTYANPDLYTWLLSHSRKSNQPLPKQP